MNGSFKQFLQQNTWQLISAGVTTFIIIIGFIVSVNLWKAGIEEKVSAQGKDIEQLKLVPAQLNTITNQLTIITANQATNADRLKETNDAVKELYKYFLK